MNKYDYLFVYGSLRRSTNNATHPFLSDYTDYISPAYLPGLLYLISDYPGAIADDNQELNLIQGEAYSIRNPTKLFTLLDEYEECGKHFPHPHEYLRTPKTIYLANKKTLTAWVYLYNRPTNTLPRIYSGDFLLPSKV